MTLGTFAEHAPALRQAGWAVLPSAGKAPIVSGFNKMRHAPQVEKWAESYPDADLVFVTGLCRTGNGRQGIVTVDCDDAEAIGWGLDFFGETPGKVSTRRGEHLDFDAVGADLGKLSSLRKYGVNIDLKHGRAGAAILAAPPSPHEKEPGFRYSWKGCDPYVLRHLPPFPAAKLFAFLEKQEPAQQIIKPRRELRDDSRKQGLNDFAVSQVCFCADFDELLDVCRTWNDNMLNRYGREPLSDQKVIDRARVVWNHHLEGRFEPMFGRGHVAKASSDEMDALLALDPKYAGDALLLLAKLRIWHGARCKRGETFPLCIRAMVRDQVLPGWTRERHQNARDLLLTAGLLKCKSEFRNTRDGRNAALYSL